MPFSDLSFPLPIFAYVWNPSPDLRVNIGLPFSVRWRPVEDLTIEMSYLPLFNVNARATYRLAEGINLYSGYETLRETYFLADRADSQDRFQVSEQRLISGVRWDLWRHATLDLNAGYAFNRFFGERQNQGGSIRDRVDVAPGAFLGASLLVRF